MTTLKQFKNDCSVYGTYQRRVEHIKNQLKQTKGNKIPLHQELSILQEKIKSIDEVLDCVEETYGVETRMTVYRVMIGKEKIEQVAEELNMDPILLQFQLEADVNTGLISIALQQYRGVYA